MSEPFIGEIRLFSGIFEPRGWAFCDGRLVSIMDNQSLYSIIGARYGGDGRTTFALPDLRSRVVVGAGAGTGLSYRPVGTRGGTENVMLTVDNIAPHTHLADVNASAGGTIEIPATEALADKTSPNGAILAKSNYMNGRTPVDVNTYSQGSSDCSMTAQVDIAVNVSVENQAAGGGTKHTNMQPYLAINYIIALDGLYPSRS